MRKLTVALLSAPIRVYRALLSPMMPGVCRFSPQEQHDDMTVIVAKCRNC